MTPKEILQYVSDHPSGKVKVAFSDIDGILRGKYISAEKFSSAIDNGWDFVTSSLDGMRAMWCMTM
jgi:glutamine synthetase